MGGMGSGLRVQLRDFLLAVLKLRPLLPESYIVGQSAN
jgi:hypothetical protein